MIIKSESAKRPAFRLTTFDGQEVEWRAFADAPKCCPDGHRHEGAGSGAHCRARELVRSRPSLADLLARWAATVAERSWSRGYQVAPLASFRLNVDAAALVRNPNKP